MKALKAALMVALISILALWLALTVACGDDDDNDPDDEDANNDTDDDFDDDVDDDDEVDRDQYCQDFCQIITECRLLQTIKLGMDSFGECIEYCLDLGDLTMADCILGAADCSGAEDCLGVSPFCQGYEGDGRCCRIDDPCRLSENLTCNCGGACDWDDLDCYPICTGYTGPDVECCRTNNPCGLADNGDCECKQTCDWDANDCDLDWCDGYTSDEDCCTDGDPCGWADNGDCQCDRMCTWEANDCDLDWCQEYEGDEDCCTNDNPCSWDCNGFCDCSGKCDWELSECHHNWPSCGDCTCDVVVFVLLDECQITFTDMNSDQMDEFDLIEWCEMCEDFISGKTDSPSWNCVGTSALNNCDQNAINACFDPCPSGGCTDTVDEIYACGIVFVFYITDYWIPEMDLAAVCDILGWPWDCYQTCADAHCPDDTDSAITCMESCTPPGGTLRKMPDSAGLSSNLFGDI